MLEHLIHERYPLAYAILDVIDFSRNGVGRQATQVLLTLATDTCEPNGRLVPSTGSSHAAVSRGRFPQGVIRGVEAAGGGFTGCDVDGAGVA